MSGTHLVGSRQYLWLLFPTLNELLHILEGKVADADALCLSALLELDNLLPPFADVITAAKEARSVHEVEIDVREAELGQRLVERGGWVDGLAIAPGTTRPLGLRMLASVSRVLLHRGLKGNTHGDPDVGLAQPALLERIADLGLVACERYKVRLSAP